MTTATPGAGIPDSAARMIKIDTEHFSIRFLLPVITLTLVLVVHFGGMRLLDDAFGTGQSPLCIVLPADVVTLFVGSIIVERLLKRAFPSRRGATLSPESLVVTDERKKPPFVVRIDWDQAVNVRAWRFTVGRKGHVPRGWFCMAVQLLQDEKDVILYSFMKEKEAEELPGYAQFVRLRPRKETLSNTDLRTVADQRRLLKLEDARWEDGGEITKEDFAALMAQMHTVLSDWK